MLGIKVILFTLLTLLEMNLFAQEKFISYRFQNTNVLGVEKVVSPGKSIQLFRGIPYAESPTGNKRWTVTNLKNLQTSGTIDARKFGNICPYQILPKLKKDYGEEETLSRLQAMSEDCLFLNIWKPAKIAKGKTLPVLFVIHGGGFVRNSTREGKIDGASLASKDVIVVSIEYRLGPLGFFNHSSFTKNSFWGNTNFGLTDQVQALRWVKQNIGRFSGNNKNVTIIGGSAGGASVYYHLSSKISKYYYDNNWPLFHRAVSIGGGGFGNLLPRQADKGQSAQTVSNTFIESLRNDPSAKCSSSAHINIRNKKYSDLLKSKIALSTIVRQCPTVEQITNHFGFKLANDNETITRSENRRYPYIDDSTVIDSGSLPIIMKNSDAFLPIPLLNGAAKNEAEVLSYLQADPLLSIKWMKNNDLKNLDERQLLKELGVIYGVNNQNYIYKNQDYFRTHFAKMFYGDGTFNQPANVIAKIHNNNANAYSYIYAYQPVAHTQWRKWQYSNRVSGVDDLYKLRNAMNDAGHTNEFFTFFGNLEARLKNAKDINSIDRKFSEKTQYYLINFMNSGNPNIGPHENLVYWHRNMNGKTLQHLGVSWIEKNAESIYTPTGYNISPLFNHKSRSFDYFEKLYQDLLY